MSHGFTSCDRAHCIRVSRCQVHSLNPQYRAVTPLPKRPGATHGIGDAVWVDEDMPMYSHVFAHVVREVLCKWWKDLLTTSAE